MTFTRTMPVFCLTLFVASIAGAQAPTPPTPPAPPRGPMPIRFNSMDRGREMEHGPGGNMGIVPPGTWWKNPDTITALTLTAEQQKKMDEIFRQNRIALIDVKASLEKEQINLEPLLNANPVDSAKALAEISKIADRRADLEKSNAKMLLGLRSVLTADQWTKLQDMQHMRRNNPNQNDRGRGKDAGRGPNGPGGGPGGPGGQNRGGQAPPPPHQN